ncbi:MAG: rhomboid family intramembrane serine protease [Porticoccaceae bacterium]|nr:rhomboid family intramembrane serine protease [Porticoccaceae bacterium]|tara:strand:- start:4415 stop:5023 length:609 start_codon:yes stop_codon:yes gene_type:complete
MSQEPNWYRVAKQYPAVTSLIVLSALGGMLVSLDYALARQTLSFSGITDGQYWRLITPIFLHFGMLHFVFNSLWLSMLGSRIEQSMGSMHLMVVVLVSGLASNITQYSWSGAVNFGGMSGVVYALLGYIWIKNMLAPQPLMALPKGIVAFMIGWLLLCMTPVVTFFLGVGIANAAHVGGLLVGMLLGLAFGLVHRLKGEHGS